VFDEGQEVQPFLTKGPNTGHPKEKEVKREICQEEKVLEFDNVNEQRSPRHGTKASKANLIRQSKALMRKTLMYVKISRPAELAPSSYHSSGSPKTGDYSSPRNQRMLC